MKNVKSFKFIILILGILLLSGCESKTNLLITSDQKVIEETSAYQSNKVLSKYNTSVEAALKQYGESYKDMISPEDYSYKYTIGATTSFGTIYKTHKSLESFIDSTTFHGLYETALISHEKDGTSFKATGENYIYILFEEPEGYGNSEAMLTKVEVAIQFQNKVLSNNADSYDEKTNTYTWIFTPNNQSKYIEFKIGKQMRYDIIFNYYLEHYLPIFIIGGIILLIALFGGLILYRKVRSTNEI